MLSAQLDLVPWKGESPRSDRFPAAGKVLFVSASGDGPWLAPLRASLEGEGRLWAPELTTVAVPGADSVANPWAFRPDLHAPLRWGDPARDIRGLGDLADAPSEVSGVVFDRILGSLDGQCARTLLAQVAELMTPEAPWLALDRNGRYLGQVIRSLRQSDEERGEGKGTWLSAQEYRRLLEVAGFGISAAWGLTESTGMGKRLRASMPGATGWPWLVLEGRRVGGGIPRPG